MEFSVVDKPEDDGTSESAKIVIAMIDNLGKAISIPLGGQDSNNLRKKIRASLMRKPAMATHRFKTRVVGDALLVWLDPRT